ncbi:two-component response regulator ARR2-like [Tasmannia lanceolata]|uniref:two-component response regulator ARR2-like n=1 Tax=Tasmannia lanceolata TaxID=3420 RepID=UPI004062F7E5
MNNRESSADSRRSGDGIVSDQFPAGLRVLVVDDDATCLKIVERMLQTCLYEVKTCSRAAVALTILRERKDGFDLVLSDVYMPDMDGFKLLEYIGLEMDLPVIMMSADDGKDVVMKGVTHGACDYLIKPVRIEAIKNIWQHVVRKKNNELKELEHSGSLEDSDRYRKPSDDTDYTSSGNEVACRHPKRRKDVKDEEEECEDREDSSTLKKPRVVWSVELHQQFVAAVNQLSIDKAVPKKILELMNVQGLTRENVASHLQKYRLYLKRVSVVSQNHGGLNTPFVGGPETSFGSISSLDGLDLQALAVSGQLPPQNLVTLQGGIGRTVNTGMDMSLVDQMNLFNSDTQISSSSKIRYGPGKQLTNKQVSLLHGLPTTMEPKQLAHLHQPVHSFGNMSLQLSEGSSGFINLSAAIRTGPSSHGDSVNGHQNSSLMLQMTQQRQHLQRQHLPVCQNQSQMQVDMSQQPRLRGQLLNEIAGGGLPAPIGQPVLSNEIASGVYGRNEAVLNVKGTSSVGACTDIPSYIAVSRPPVDFPVIHGSQFPGNGFPVTSYTRLSNLASTGMIQTIGSMEGLDPNLKGHIGLAQSYDPFNTNITYDATQHVNSVQRSSDFTPAFGHHGFVAAHKNGHNKNTFIVDKGMVSMRREDVHGNQESIAECHNNVVVDNSSRVKTESMPHLGCENILLNEHFAQEDIMSALYKQQQEGAGLVDTDFNFDGYPMDNISV